MTGGGRVMDIVVAVESDLGRWVRPTRVGEPRRYA